MVCSLTRRRAGPRRTMTCSSCTAAAGGRSGVGLHPGWRRGRVAVQEHGSLAGRCAGVGRVWEHFRFYLKYSTERFKLFRQ